MGSALSPNGLGFSDGGADEGGNMVSCSLMDKVVEVDRVSGRARVQVCNEGLKAPCLQSCRICCAGAHGCIGVRRERGGWVLAGAQVLRWFTHAQNTVQTIPVHVCNYSSMLVGLRERRASRRASG